MRIIVSVPKGQSETDAYTGAVIVPLLLIVAAFTAGALNSVAGGGSFLTFPALVFAGVPAVIANASNTVALAPGSLASSVSYRKELQEFNREGVRAWLIVSLLGGIIGAALLLCTSDKLFRQIAPWLLLLATLLFAFGNRLSLALRGRLHASQILMITFLFPVSVYGGYFGGGIGIIILAGLRLYGLTDIHSMNGIKTLIAGSLNTVAAVVFIAAHQVYWRPTLFMMGAAILGGYAGPVIARRISQHLIRAAVIFVGATMTIYFFNIAPK